MLIKENLLLSLINYIVVFGLKLGVRIAFVRALSLEYLGINGLFTEILSMLSLVELGLGPSIVYSLYKPLVEKNRREISGIMQLFKKLYVFVGIVIFLLGVLVYPWLDYLIKTAPTISEWKLYYLIFLFNTAISYFWSFQRNLLIADQKQYIVHKYDCCVQFCIAMLQILILLLTNIYCLYLLVMVVGTIVENILLDRKAKKDYLLLTDKIDVLPHVKQEIVANVKALLLHKVTGSMVLSSTNLILVKLVGLTAVGLCSNYLLIINTINALGNKLIGSLTATVGHKLILDEQALSQNLFNRMHFVTSALASICSVGLYTLLNPFVELWLGKDYLLPETVVAYIVLYFYLHFMRRVPLLFRDAAGLFMQDRYKAVAELLLNVILSIVFVQKYGVSGVFIAGIISTICTCTWAEPYVVFRYSLGLSLKCYLQKFLCHSFFTIFAAVVWKYLYIAFIGTDASIIGFISAGIFIVIIMGSLWFVIWRFECVS